MGIGTGPGWGRKARRRSGGRISPETTILHMQDDLIQHYTLNEADMALVRQRRGEANRLGFAVQLCLLRFPGYARGNDLAVPDPVIQWVARQIRANASAWANYGERDTTRREHLLELRAYLALTPFGRSDFRFLVHSLADLAMQTDKGMLLATHALAVLRQRGVILPALSVIDRACAEGITRANRRIYRALIEPLDPHHLRRLDDLLEIRPGSGSTWLAWLRQSPRKPNSRYMMEHIERPRCSTRWRSRTALVATSIKTAF